MDSLLLKFTSNSKVKKILSKRPGDKGFSLVELVVVIAVLAILSAVAIPAFQGVQARAKTSAVKNGLTNGVKECIVRSGLDQPINWIIPGTLNRSAQAYAGNYSGYSIGQRNNIDNCFNAEATPDANSGLPVFTISYEIQTGITTTECAPANAPGCPANNEW